MYSWEQQLTPSFAARYYSLDPKGDSFRLVHLDAPERGTKGYDQARLDVIEWLSSVPMGRLRAEILGSGAFDRSLVDIYEEGFREYTLSDFMIQEKGWLPYMRALPMPTQLNTST